MYLYLYDTYTCAYVDEYSEGFSDCVSSDEGIFLPSSSQHGTIIIYIVTSLR
jgi:hypothetical protein